MRALFLILLACWILARPTQAASDPSALIAIGEFWHFKSASRMTAEELANWYSPALDDGAWPAGLSGFSYGYGTLADFTPLASAVNGAVESAYYFRRTFAIQAPENIRSLILRIDYDDGFIAYLNGVEIIRRNMPGPSGQPVGAGTVALGARYRGPAEEIEWIAPTNSIVAGDNVLAIEVHASSAFDYSLSFSGELLANLSRGPSLQAATTRSAIIAWKTPTPTDGAVAWGLTESLGSLSSSAGATNQHAVLLSGLEPNTRYFYRVTTLANGRSGVSEMASFKTHAESGALRFVVLADSGGGGVRQRQVARRIREAQPDLVIQCGDIVYPGFAENLLDQRCLSIYRDLMARVPFYWAAGNHDLLSGETAYFDAFHSLTNEMTGTEHFYSFDAGEAHFVVLFETWMIQNQIRIGDPQYQWLTNDLARSSKPWKFLFLHHPIRTSGLHRHDDYGGFGPSFPNGLPDRLDLLAVLQPVAARYGVQAIFSGHDHHYERFNPVDGVHQIVSGGGGGSLYYLSALDADSSQFWAVYHCVVADLSNEQLRLRALDYAGNEIDNYTIHRAPSNLAPIPIPFHSPEVNPSALGSPDGDGNFAGQTFDFVGESSAAICGRNSNLGQMVLNYDANALHLGLRSLALPRDYVGIVFLEVPGIRGVPSLAGLGDGQLNSQAPQPEILDVLENLSFFEFAPSIAIIVGDEFSDATIPGARRSGSDFPFGQGIFRLLPELPPVTGAQIQQFNRSPQAGPVPGEQNADFVEITIPWTQLGGQPSNATLRAAAIALSARGNGNHGAPAQLFYDSGYHGSSMRATAGGGIELAPAWFRILPINDPDGDELPTEEETRIGTRPDLADTDGDGLPDGWEYRNGLNPLSAGGTDGAGGDTDGDRSSNLSEWIAGSNPRLSESKLALQVKPLANGKLEIQWEAVGGRRYLVERADGLNKPFIKASEVRVQHGAASSVQTFIDSADTSDVRYYRLGVALD